MNAPGLGLLGLAILLAAPARAADPFEDYVRKTEPLAPEAERTALHVPPGFGIQLVASEPEIGKPMNMAFDVQGRLWLTQSREYPYAAPLDKPGRDVIKVLSDFDERGRARKVVTFAEGLNIPIGLYPYKRGVIAFSIPNIYYFEDTDGDGRADKQELVLGRFGFDRDVHGLTSAFRRGFDGWLYADHGYNNNTTLKARDGSSITMNSGNTYRFQPDGGRVEQFTWGQVNPFGLMFDSLGDLWSADCHSSPVYQLLRGAYYPSFGKPNDGLGFGPNICTHDHGSTAIAGMVYYAAESFPREYRGNTFVGNVMTCRIDRDSLVEQGSTRIAREESDFLRSDDPWFRPVDLQLGPDGAIYVADFYNRIIGHYEVPLDHPGRDRERGRIWRIAYRGTPVSLGLPMTTEGLLAELGSPNLARRMLAMNELVDHVGQAAVVPVEKVIRDPKSAAVQRIHGLWVLHRLHGLDEKTLGAAARDPDRGLRVHAQRVLSETATWSPEQRDLARAGLNDPDPYVLRAAADAVGRHPAFDWVQPLLDLRHRLESTADSQLRHVVRMALRDQLTPGDNLVRLAGSPLAEEDSRAVADVAVAIRTTEAGGFLAEYIARFSGPPDRLTTYLRHAARYAPETEVGALAAFARRHFAGDLDLQIGLFKSIQEAAAERGAALAPAARDWGAELAERLLAADPASSGWRNQPLPGFDSTNPWVVEKRASSDGEKASPFVSSLSAGGERFTGSLRSKTFVIPAGLGFFLAGHDGVPGKPPQGKNVFRLRDAKSNEVLASTPPPRNDLAQQFRWDLAAHAGENGYLELVDGDTGSGFAWLALGRLNPPVAALPAVSPRDLDQRQQAGAELAGSLRLAALEPRLAAVLEDSGENPEVRAAAAKAMVGLGSGTHEAALSNLLSQADEPMKLRERLAVILGEINSPWARAALVEALRAAPAGLQTEIALGLCSHREGAEELLQAVADGKASARVLVNRRLKDRLEAVRPAGMPERLQALTANLPAAGAEREQLLEARRAAFHPAEASPTQGASVFKQFCAICHSLDGQGAVIGPQLDGIGARGTDRLIEDILDPNRNVDRAFRTTLLILKDGDVQSGLFRREEGQMLILADSTGKEIAVAKQDVKQRRESETSLMPDNFSDAIPAADFNSLLAFLVSKNRKAQP